MKTSENLKMNKVGAGHVSAHQENGITLVALIITIIVMLILVGVSVQVVINSNLIGTAQDAADRTEAKYQEESNISEIAIGDETYNSLQEYIQENCDHIYSDGVCTNCGIIEWITFYIDGYTLSAKAGETWYDYCERVDYPAPGLTLACGGLDSNVMTEAGSTVYLDDSPVGGRDYIRKEVVYAFKRTEGFEAQ